MPKNWNDWSLLIFSLFIPSLTGMIGSAAAFTALPRWYGTLMLPPFAPPSWIFGPVWGVLYLFLGVTLYILWRSKRVRSVPLLKAKEKKKKEAKTTEQARDRKKALLFFGIQLALNALWPVLFFGFKNPLFGLIDIVFLIAAIALTMWYAAHVNRVAFYLLVPYMLWVLFAGALNGAIVYLN